MPEENTAALIEGLARLLLFSQNTLENMDLQINAIFTHYDLFIRLWDGMKRRNQGAFPVLPELRRFGFRPGFVDSPGFQHMIGSSPKLSQLCVGEMKRAPLEKPKVPLTRLKALRVVPSGLRR